MRKLFISLIILTLLVFVGCDEKESGEKSTQKPDVTIASTPTPAASPTATPVPTSTPEEGINVALEKEFEVSSATENSRGWLAEHINDGITEVIEGIHYGWTSQTGKYVDDFNEEDVSEWVIIDLGKEYNIEMVKAWPRQDEDQSNAGLYFPVDYQVDLSNDKESWETVYEKKDDLGAENHDVEPRIMKLENAKGRYVRFMGTKLTNIHAAYQNDGLLMQIAELEVFSRD